MQDTEFYRKILGLQSPWMAQQVDLDIEGQRVDVQVEHGSHGDWCCPECDRQLATYDHVAERAWPHLDTCQFQTILHARIPRVGCHEHGVKQFHVPWAVPGGRFTLLFERFAIDVLLNCQTTLGAYRILNISWDQGWQSWNGLFAAASCAKRPESCLGWESTKRPSARAIVT